jgi:DNA-binding response OmpR family regulator
MRILIAEDDAPLASFVAKALTEEEHQTEIAADGEAALAKLVAQPFDLLILDLNLPVLDGNEVLKRLRGRGSEIPILILTATDNVTERVACLDAGADDYLTKPFSYSELAARLRALYRRKGPPVQTVLRVEDLELDCVQRTVVRAGVPIELTPKEFSLLEYFMRNLGRQITRNMIIQYVWKLAPGTMTNVVDVYVNYLRKKIDENAKVKLIRTVRGVGYEFGPSTHQDDADQA